METAELPRIEGQLTALTNLCAALTIHHPRRTQLLWLIDAQAAEVDATRGESPTKALFADGYKTVVAFVRQAALDQDAAGKPGS